MTGRSLLRVAVALVAIGCSTPKMIEMPYLPLAAPEPGAGPVDVIRDLEAHGQLPPLHTVRLPDGDVEYRFGIVGHMVLGGTNTIVRVTRSAGVVRGEVWCHRLAWELKDSVGGMLHQIARTQIEKRPAWDAILDSIGAIGLMRYSAPRAVTRPATPGEVPLVPRDQTDQPSLLFEGREGPAYRSLSIYGHTPEDRPEWPRVAAAIGAVWGEQKYACSELSPETREWDPHSTTRWRILPDSGRVP